MDGVIRKAEPRDLPVINELLRDVLKVHYDGRPDLFNEEGKKYTDSQILDILANPQTPVFVYESNGSVLGYAFCAFNRAEAGSLRPITTLYLDDLCVGRDARGQGIGKALFEYVKKFAKQNGCYNVTLHVWECNPGALAFYESLGLKRQYYSMEAICE